MRVIHVAPTPFGADGLFGGGERYPLELARAMARHVDCQLLTFAARPAAYQEADGLRIRVLRTVTRYAGHPAHPISPTLPRAVAGADLIHTHHLRAVPSLTAATVGRLLGRTVAVTDHGLAGGNWGGLLPRLFDRFLTVSEYSAQQLGAPPEQTTVVYAGVDPTRFRPEPSVVRRGVLFVGRITPHKGIDVLIRALPPGVPLQVGGSSGHDPRLPERDYPALLATLAHYRNVAFLGPVPDDELPALYARAQVLCLPSLHNTVYGRRIEVSELLGLVVLEAMASGTPVVASRIGGLPEIVRDGETGYLVEPGNVEELRDRLATLVGDPHLIRRMGQAGRELVAERFTWEACAQRCLGAYHQASRGTPGIPRC